MHTRFFPSNIRFWLINLGGWILVFLASGVGNVVTEKGIMMQLFGGTLFVLYGILLGLLYRYLYHQRKWQDKSIFQLIWHTLLFVLVGAFIAGVLVAIYLKQVQTFFPEWLPPSAAKRNPLEIYFLLFVGNFSGMVILQSLWCSIYIAVMIHRKSINRKVMSLRLENALKEAQLNTLSNQLNPHFLFNALNNIRFMMRKDTNRAEEMIAHLSSLLRHALQSSNEGTVNIAKELEIVDHFINLAQIQFNERLTFTKQISPHVEKYSIPPMVLQILIENAIKHGFDELKYAGELNLSISEQGEHVEIKVANTVSEQQVNPLNTKAKKGLGIGLSNIKQRLKLLYGDEAGLVAGLEQEKFMVRLTLPKELS